MCDRGQAWCMNRGLAQRSAAHPRGTMTGERTLWPSAGAGPGLPADFVEAFGSQHWDTYFPALSLVPWTEAQARSHSWGWAAAGCYLPHRASSLVSAQKGMVKGKTTSKHFLESTLYSGLIKRGQKSRGDLNPLFFAIISWIRAATFSITLVFAADFYPITESNKKIRPKDYYPVAYSRFHWHGWQIDFKGNFIML